MIGATSPASRLTAKIAITIIVTDKDNPFAFDSIGVEIMKSASYTYSYLLWQ
jgi:hypothetical protein